MGGGGEDFTFSEAGSGGGVPTGVKEDGYLFSEGARFILVMEHLWGEWEEF